MYGGSYIPATLVPAARELAAKYIELRDDRISRENCLITCVISWVDRRRSSLHSG